MFARRKKSVSNNAPQQFTAFVNSPQIDLDSSRSKNAALYQTYSVRSRSLPPLSILEPDSIWADSEAVSAYESLRRSNMNNKNQESSALLVAEFDSPFHTNYRIQTQNLNQNFATIRTPELFSIPLPGVSLSEHSSLDVHLEPPGVFSPYTRKSSFLSNRDSNSHQSNSSQSHSLTRTNPSPSVMNLTPPSQISASYTIYTDSHSRRTKTFDVSKPILLTTSSNIQVVTRDQAMLTHGPVKFRLSKQDEDLNGTSFNHGQDYLSQLVNRVDDERDMLSIHGSLKSSRSKRSNSLSIVDVQSPFNLGNAPPVPQLPTDINSVWKMAAVEASEQFAVEDTIKQRRNDPEETNLSLPSHIFDLNDTNSQRVFNSQIPISHRMNSPNLQSTPFALRPAYSSLSNQIVPEFEYDDEEMLKSSTSNETKNKYYSLDSTLESSYTNGSKENVAQNTELQKDSQFSLGRDKSMERSPKLLNAEILGGERELMLRTLRPTLSPPPPLPLPSPPPTIPSTQARNSPGNMSIGPASAPVISQSKFSPVFMEHVPPPLPPPQIPPPQIPFSRLPSQPTSEHSIKFNQQSPSSNYRFSYQSEKTTLDRVNHDREIFEFSPSPVTPSSLSYSPYPQTPVPRKESIHNSEFRFSNKSMLQMQEPRKSTDIDSHIPRSKFSINSHERQNRPASPRRSVAQQARDAFLKVVGFGKSARQQDSIKLERSDPSIIKSSNLPNHFDENKSNENQEEISNFKYGSTPIKTRDKSAFILSTQYGSPDTLKNLDLAEKNAIRTLNYHHHHLNPLLGPLMNDDDDDDERARRMLERYAKNSGFNLSATSVSKDPEYFFKQVDSLPISPSLALVGSLSPTKVNVKRNAENSDKLSSFSNTLATIKIRNSFSSEGSEIENSSDIILAQSNLVYHDKTSKSTATSIISFGSEYSLNSIQPSEIKSRGPNLSNIEGSSLHHALNLASSTTVTSSASELPIIESTSILDELSAELKLEIDNLNKFELEEITNFNTSNSKNNFLTVESSYAHILDEDLLAMSPKSSSRSVLLDLSLVDAEFPDQTFSSSYATNPSPQPYNSLSRLTSPHPSLSRIIPTTTVTRSSTINSTATVTEAQIRSQSSEVIQPADTLIVDRKSWIVNPIREDVPQEDDETATVHSGSRWTFGSRGSYFKAYSDELDTKSASMRSGSGYEIPLGSAMMDDNISADYEEENHKYAVWGGDI
ncbi:hypothetical protein HK096_005314 [Nowakowskiella sp. JEL0078]|nr:hypothetical protein HK096_005314 [Nowakowskiella sp. JEL0078]